MLIILEPAAVNLKLIGIESLGMIHQRQMSLAISVPTYVGHRSLRRLSRSHDYAHYCITTLLYALVISNTSSHEAHIGTTGAQVNHLSMKSSRSPSTPVFVILWSDSELIAGKVNGASGIK